MAEVNFTEKQRLAIDDRNHNILISAAAGSGKTAVLVERIKRLILEDRASVSHMLIVTFTELASSEMKEKIVKAIKKEIKITDSENRARLKEELNLIPSANISTFHSFCMDVIKRFYYLIDMEPNLKVIDDSENDILMEESLEELIDIYFEEDNQDFKNFLNKYTSGRNLDDFKEMVLELYDKVMALDEPFLFLDHSLKNFSLSGKDFLDRGYLDIVKDNFVNRINEYLEAYDNLISYVRENEIPTLEGLLLSDIDEINRIKENVYSLDFDSFKNDKVSFARFNIKSYMKGITDEDYINEVRDVIKSVRDDVKEYINNFKKRFFFDSIDDLMEDLYYTKTSSEFLVSSVKKYHEIFSSRKIKKGLMTFSDMEHYAYTILKCDEASNYYRDKFEHIFIDEYQDTNGIQDAIISKIKRSNNLFMVGDLKQSIYRFRNADPAIFKDKYRRYEEGEDSSLKIDLNSNFRSKKKVVDFVNSIFKDTMENYNENEMLHGEASYVNDAPQDVKLFLINKNTMEDEDIDNNLIEYSRIEKEALACARVIKENVLKEGYSYKDIRILLRNMKNRGDIFFRVLNENGIPTYIDDNDGYFDTIEINTFMSLLNVIDNWFRDMNLVTVMRSEIFGFTIPELSDIRLSDMSAKNFKICIDKYIESGSDLKLKDKCNRMLNAIEGYRDLSKELKLEDFIFEVLNDTKFYLLISTLPLGDKRRNNLNLLMDKARIFRENNSGNLYDFIKYIERVKKHKINISQFKTEDKNGDYVKVMTIHKSKGLEFPVVIIPNYNHNINKMNGKGSFVFNKDIGFSLGYVDYEKHFKKNTLLKNIITEVNSIEDMKEIKRLLYVAFTRAKDELYLVASVDDKDSIIDELNIKPRSNTSFLTMTGKTIFKDLSKVILMDDTKLKVRSYKADRDLEYINKVLNDEDLSYSSNIDKMMNYQYMESPIKSKYSVSEINSKSYEIDYKVSEHIAKNEDEFTRAEIGTILHKVLLHLDFKKGREEGNTYIDNLLKEMMDDELLSLKEKDSIDRDSVLKLLNSDLASRIINSKEVFREQNFNIKYMIDGEETLVQGIIDLFFIEDDHIVLVDYKSTLHSDEKYVKETYQKQIDIYKEAIEKGMKIPVKSSYLYLTNYGKLIEM